MTTASPPFRCYLGDNHLGGDDWDRRISWLIDQVKADQPTCQDAVALQRLKEAAEQAKKGCPPRASTNISLRCLSMTADGPITG